MRICFAWAKASQEQFDPKQHAREDETIFSLNLSQEEGQPAVLSMVVLGSLERLSAFQDKKKAFLSVRFHDGKILCLLKGNLISYSVEGVLGCVTLKLEAVPDDLAKQVEAHLLKAEQQPLWDPLFVDPTSPKDPREVGRVQPVTFEIDRVDHRVCLSSLFQGKQQMDVSDIFFQDSLRMKPSQIPAASVAVSLEVQWVQQVTGYLNLGKHIKALFREKQINTLTGDAFKKAWPKLGKRLGKSGYWVASSHLEEVFPSDIFCPRISKRFKMLSDNRGERQVSLKRFWFKARLILGWAYRQKRIETLTFTLSQSIHPIFQSMASTLPHQLHFRLQDIHPARDIPFWKPHGSYEKDDVVQIEGTCYRCTRSGESPSTLDEAIQDGSFAKQGAIPTALKSSDRASFFLTDRGYQAFEHALERAQTYLARQARCIEVSFSGPFERLCQLTLDHHVVINDSRLPGGAIRGKVIRYAMHAGERLKDWRVEVTLGVSIGDQARDQPLSVSTLLSNYAPGYFEPAYGVTTGQRQQSIGGIWFERYDDQAPGDAFEGLARQNPDSLIQHLQLQHSAQEQENLLENKAKMGELNQHALKEKSTQIRLKLGSLKGEKALEHHIEATLFSSYQAPCDVGKRG